MQYLNPIAQLLKQQGKMMNVKKQNSNFRSWQSGRATCAERVKITMKKVANNVKGILFEDCGRWIPEEAPELLISESLASLQPILFTSFRLKVTDRLILSGF